MRGAALLCVGLLAAACSGDTGGVSSGNATSIEFATQGLGSEGDATKKAVAEFENATPNIHVIILTLSPPATMTYQQLRQSDIAGSSALDAATAQVIWPATFARSNW